MGVNTLLYLPDDVRVRDVGDVMGAAAGLAMTKHLFDEDKGEAGGWSANVDGVEFVNQNHSPGILDILLKGEMVDGEEVHFCSYHFETEDRWWRRMAYPKSTAFWIAVSKKVVDFFGGRVVFNDAGDDSDSANRYDVKPRFCNNPTKDKARTVFQQKKMDVEAVTYKELAEVNELAGYDTMEQIKIHHELLTRLAIIDRHKAKVAALEAKKAAAR